MNLAKKKEELYFNNLERAVILANNSSLFYNIIDELYKR